jgi:hypothetical protein
MTELELLRSAHDIFRGRKHIKRSYLGKGISAEKAALAVFGHAIEQLENGL